MKKYNLTFHDFKNIRENLIKEGLGGIDKVEIWGDYGYVDFNTYEVVLNEKRI